MAALGGCAALAAGPAVGQDFWVVAMNGNGATQDFVDVATIRVAADGHVRAWVTSVVAQPSESSSSIKTELKEELFKCAAEQLAVVQALAYNAQHNLISTQSASAQYIDVAPGSWGAEELRFVCSRPTLRSSNPNWVHITGTPETFTDNVYKTLHANHAP
jgi:hypothetical protein